MGCITWLVDAGVITTCYCLSYPELPLKGNYDDSKFKLYYPDTGLLIASLDEEAQEDLRANKNMGVYKGALYEKFRCRGVSEARIRIILLQKKKMQLWKKIFLSGQKMNWFRLK